MTQKKNPGLSRPPQPTSQPQDPQTTAFIQGAEQQPETPSAGGYPWEDASLRTDVTKAFNLRLSEPTRAKLRWLADNTPQSMHTIALEAVEAEIERRLQELVGK